MAADIRRVTLDGRHDLPRDQNTCCVRARNVLKTLEQNDKFRLVMSLVLGQVLSLLLCGTGVTSQLLQTSHSIHVPTTQSFINYTLLTVVFGVSLATRKDFMQVLWKNWWKYVILGVIDVEANYMIVRAYEYTNLTTIQLLDSFTIVCVMVLSFFFLRVRYKLVNLMGVSLALVGIACLVLATLMSSGNQSGSNPLLGDLLCLGGSALYAVSNVAQEFLVKNHSITEFLGLIGVSGCVVSAIQLLVLERESLARIDWSYDIGLQFFGFGVCMFVFYSVMPHVMRFSSAVVVNLSLLSADIYTLFFGLYLFHFMFSFFYIVALFLIIAGVFIYNIVQPKVAKKDKSQATSRTSKPPTQTVRESESPSIREDSRNNKGLLLFRGLLESSTFVSSSGDTLPRIRRKKSRLRNSLSSSYPPSTESPFAQGSPLNTPTSPSTYGSVSLSAPVASRSDFMELESFRELTQIPEQEADSSERLESFRELTQIPEQEADRKVIQIPEQEANTSQLVSVTQYPINYS